ncbi:MAG: glycogen-binding domain-containing protein [Luteolibacter sp.]
MNDPKPATVPTPFSCKAPDAQKVYLSGTFNNWDDVLIPMRRHENGIWTTIIDLSPGRHEYKFIVDGEWCCTPYCSDQATCIQCVTNEHGTMNRVIEIP